LLKKKKKNGGGGGGGGGDSPSHLTFQNKMIPFYCCFRFKGKQFCEGIIISFVQLYFLEKKEKKYNCCV